MARTDSCLVLAPFQRAIARDWPHARQRLRRPGPARTGLGVGRRRLRAPGLLRQSRTGRRGQAAFLRRGGAFHRRPRELRHPHAGRDAVVAVGGGRDRESRLSLRAGRAAMTQRALIGCLLACLASQPVAWSGAAAALPGDSVYQLPASLTDSAGRAVRWQDLQGQPRVATMFYASCRYICPMVVDSLRAVERELSEKERQRIAFVLISMDPARDTPEALDRKSVV